MTRRLTRSVAEEIFQIEGFGVRFVPALNDTGKRLDDYPYERAAASTWTVKKWRVTRFEPNYPGVDVEVLDGDGDPVHGKTLLATLRTTYLQKPAPPAIRVLGAPALVAESQERALADTGTATVTKDSEGGHLDVKALETWLWDAACQIRGPLDAPKFKDYILPLIFLKRLSDVFDEDVRGLADEVGDLDTAKKIVEEDHAVVHFYVPAESRWSAITLKTTGLGEALTDAVRAVARQNPRLQGVIDTVDFNATTAGQQIVDNDRLAALVKTLGQYRLGLRDVQADLLGNAYEYLIRKFAEGQGQSAGEFYTPAEVGRVMARILDPQPGMTVYDPCCGSSGLLIKCNLRLLETRGKAVNEHRELPPDIAPLKLFGQEINPATFAMSRMNAFLHDMDAEIALGDTMRNPAFTDRGGHLRQFDLVTANPMWNQDFPEDVYRNDTSGRFRNGIPPASSADWGWVQHMIASLKPRGRMAIVLDTGAVSRGTGNTGTNRERDIRRTLVEEDLVEAVILLPENLFYNTPAQGIVMVFNREKTHPSEIALVDASGLFVKGKPKNELTDDHITTIHRLIADWQPVDGRCAVVTKVDVAAKDYNLSPSRYVAGASSSVVLPLGEAVKLLREAEANRAAADAALWRMLEDLGIEGESPNVSQQTLLARLGRHT